jgi:transcriptional regulator with XRE-family HTH domain
MILNDRQYQSTQKRLRESEEKIRQLRSGEGSLAADDRRVATASLVDFSKQLRREVEQYEALRDGRVPLLPIESFGELPTALIQGRIARGLTQGQLADRLGMPEQQVQRYEATRYASADLDRLRQIADALALKVGGGLLISAPAEAELKPIWRKPLILMVLTEVDKALRRPVDGVLELHKLLVTVDTSLSRQLHFHAFEFEPYRFGAFDPFLEDDVEILCRANLVGKAADEDQRDLDPILGQQKRAVPIAAQNEASKWLGGFLQNDKVATPELKRQILALVAEVARTYGSLGTTELLKRTYKDRPDLTVRSEIRERLAGKPSR